jgi:hypothetical protein
LAKRRFLQKGEQPTMDFVIEFPDGTIGEAASPFYLCDLIFHPDYTSCDDPRTWFVLSGQRLRDIATELGMERLRVTVYDALGAFYDNVISRFHHAQADLEIENPNQPIILDGYDPWTSIASLIRCGYIRLWEKVPTFSDKKKVQGCQTCVFRTEKDGRPYCLAWDYKNAMQEWEKPCWWVTCGQRYDRYVEVTPANLCNDYSHKKAYKPVEQRKQEYIGFRYENIRAAMEEKS